MQSTIKAKGIVTERLYKNGQLIATHTSPNLILNNAGTILAKLLGNGDASQQITQVGFGEGTAVPTPNDTALTNATFTAVQSANVSVAGQVTFNYLLDYADANGQTITERALAIADNTLFSRIVRPAIAKDANLAISGEWTIIFTGE